VPFADGVVPVPLNTLLTSDQYAYVLAICARGLLVCFRGAAAGGQGHVGRMADLDHVIVAGNDAHGYKGNCPMSSRRKLLIRDRSDSMPEEPAFRLYSSGSTACRGRAASSFKSCRHG